jgi:Rieske Fe-S protein
MTDATPNSPARRTVLAGVGLAGAATVLTACGGSGSKTDAAGSTPSGSASDGGTSGGATAGGGAATPTDGSSGSSSGGSTGGAAAGGMVLGATSDVPVGGGKVFTAEKVVVTQPTAGDFKAFTAICTHAGCTVSTVSDGTINCPCHGSQYHIADGSVARGPAPAPLVAKTIAVSGGKISLS